MGKDHYREDVEEQVLTEQLKPLSYPCRWCPCVFSTKADLERHLEVFGDRPHLGEWRALHRRYDPRW